MEGFSLMQSSINVPEVDRCSLMTYQGHVDDKLCKTCKRVGKHVNEFNVFD